MSDSPPISGAVPASAESAALSAQVAEGSGATAQQANRPVPQSLDSTLTQEDMDLLAKAAAEAHGSSSASRPGSAKRRAPGKNGSQAAAPGVESWELPEFSSSSGPPLDADRIAMLSDVTLNVKIELGRTRMLVEDVLRLDAGSVVELDKLAGDPVDVFANDRLIARGEVLVLNDSFCVRISEVFAGDPHRVV